MRLASRLFERYFCHSRLPNVILWEPAEEKDIPKTNSKFKTVSLDELLALVPLFDPELKTTFQERAAQKLNAGRTRL